MLLETELFWRLGSVDLDRRCVGSAAPEALGHSMLEDEAGQVGGDHDYAEQNDEYSEGAAKLLRAEMLGQLDAEIRGEQGGKDKFE
jgi:hypothetical protein